MLWMWLVIAGLLLGVMPAGADGQAAEQASGQDEPAHDDRDAPDPAPTLMSAGGVGGGSHGWVLMPGGRPGEVVLWFAPPRSLRSAGEPAPDGAFKRVRELAEAPAMMAAFDRRLYLLFAKPGGEATLRSIDAVPGAVAGTWGYLPGGRLRAHPSPGESDRLRGLAGTAGGPVAWMRGDDGAAVFRLLQDDAWVTFAPPPAEGSVRALVALESGIGVLCALEGGGLELWIGEPDEPRAAGETGDNGDDAGGNQGEPRGSGRVEAEDSAMDAVPSATSESWTWRQSAVFAGVDGRAVLRGVVGGEFVEVTRAGGVATLTRIAASGARMTAAIEIGDELLTAMALPDAGRVVLVTVDAANPTRVTVREVSVWTGRVLYEGPPRYTSPISPTEFRLLALGLFAMVAMLLVFLLRDSGEDALALPPGFALADPIKRLAALGADLLIAGWVCSRLLGIGVLDAFTIDALAVDRGGHWGLVVTLGIGLVLGVAGEGTFGASAGKLLFGLRVRVATADGCRPGLRRAMVRNACKWVVPPLALVALFDPNGRHRGDALSGTVVVERAPRPGEPADGSGEDRGAPDRGPGFDSPDQGGPDR